MKNILLTTLISLGLCTAQAAENQAPPIPVMALDVPRYLGTWYEIAKYPNRFQKQCAKNTRAEYRLGSDGKLQVLNRCLQQNGAEASVLGAARQIGPADSPKLEVRFAPAWLSWLPMVWANYWVIDLDEAYSLAAVSEPSREYLWILSRSPEVDPARYTLLLDRLAHQGFDLQRLELSPQD
jgi:apolipoprotein D and lipocalin family protein